MAVGQAGSESAPGPAVEAPGIPGVAEPATQTVLTAAPEIIADTLGEYIRAWVRKVRSGDSGVLPVIVGLVLIVIVFQVQNHLYLSAGNLVNLFNQTVLFVLFAMSEVFVLLLGEIDLSVVYNAGIGAGLMAALVAPPYNLPWWVCILIGLATTTVTGLVMGTLITRLRLPAFIVTLGGFLGLQGIMIWMFDRFSVAVGGVIEISNRVMVDLINGNLSQVAGWVTMAIAVVVFGIYTVLRDQRRRAAGLVTPPMGLTLLKAAAVAVAGVVVVLICNINRGAGTTYYGGVPWSIPILLVIFGGTTILLGRTKFGRYVYAIGGNTEAARRAGINVPMVRTIAFGLAGFMAGLAGLMYLSTLQSIATDIDSFFVLYAVAAAVIGGTSLFGGRGKPLHALLGGLVIAAVYNGTDLLGLSAAADDMLVALVLLVAVTVDTLTRGGQRAR